MSIKDRLSFAGIALKEVLSNRVSLAFLGIGAGFWLLSPIINSGVIPGVTMGTVIAAERAALIGLPLAISWSYMAAAVAKLRSGDSGGVTQWLTGVVWYFFLFAMGSIYTLVWIYRGRPDDMTVSSLLAFLLLGQIVGQSMLITSPGATSKSIPRSNWKWLIGAAIIASLVIGFTIGTMAGKQLDAGGMVVAEVRPACPSELPVWGNQRRMIYHAPNSPYRGMVRPDRCFASIQDAIAAGYREPG